MSADPAVVSAQVDLRGFVYALAPFVCQQEWRMDRVRNALATLQQALTTAEAERENLHGAAHTAATALRRRLDGRGDIDGHRRGLEYLARLQHRIVQEQRRIDELLRRRTDLQAEMRAQQRKLDGLDEHRAGELQAYAQEAARRLSAEADRDWISRTLRPVAIEGPP